MAVAVCAANVSVSNACGPYFPNAYLVYGQEYTILDLPEPSFYHEVSKILAKRPHMENSWDDEYKTEWERTLDADVADLDDALKTNGVDDATRSNLTSKYLELRTSMAPPPAEDAYAYTDPESEDPAGGEDNEAATPDEFPQAEIDLSPYAELLTAIPQEFALYVKGAAKFRAGDSASAAEAWKAILAMPEDQRKYRSTWAAYMLGRVALGTNLDEARAQFAQVQTFAQDGYRDSLHLAPYSTGYVAMNELATGNYVPAMKLYAEMISSGPPHEQFVGYNSLRIACDMACGDTIDPAIAADPLCRQIVSAWVMSHPGSPELAAIWSKAIEDAGVTGVLPDADRLAWAAYSAGDMPMAAKWLESASPDAPYAKWVRSKLLMRDGKIDEAIALLRDLAKTFPTSDRWLAQDYEQAYLDDQSPEANIMLNDFLTERTAALSTVRAELGVLLLGRGDYINAFDTLVHSGYWMDAAYIAERVLTVDEVVAYLADHANDADLQQQGQLVYSDEDKMSRYDMIRYVLARRYMRLGRYDEALAQFPPTLKPDAEKLVAALRASASARPMGWGEWISTSVGDWWNSTTTPFIDRPRAEQYFAAAQLVRAKGIELMGTELEPDWQSFYGNFELDGATHHRAFDEQKTPVLEYTWSEGNDQSILEQVNPAFKQAIQATDDEKKRVWDSAPSPNKRFHYRYTAADLMWQCAAQLPKNDPLSLRALYWGGTYLKHRDPQAANKFYKAMVIRNWSMPYAQMADKLRWFPEEEPDEKGNAIPAPKEDDSTSSDSSEATDESVTPEDSGSAGAAP